MLDAARTPAALDFLHHPGEAARLIAELDWTDTLGPIDTWPSSLKTAIGLLIHSPVPLVLLWGEDGIMIYNDAYSVFAGARHPRLLGSKVREGWAEIADFNDNVMRVGLAGGTLAYRDQELTLWRNGAPEQVWMNLDYSPVLDESGRPAGVIAIVVETTEQVQTREALRESEARLRFLDSLGVEASRLSSADAILSTTTRMVAEHLGVSVCAYADMDADGDGFNIRGDWAADGSQSIVGHYSLASFGAQAVRELSAGRPLIINDVLRELPDDEAVTFQTIGVAATVCMPLVKDGRLTALMAIHNKSPRVWSAYDIAIIREVTERSWAHVERAAAEAVVRDSEQNFRTLARAMPTQVWTAGPDGALDWFSDHVYAYSGHSRGSLDGAGWTRMVHPKDLADAQVRWANSLSSGDDYEVEFRLRRHDGAWRWHLARAKPIRGEFRQIIRWIGTNTDIHDQTAAAATLADVNAALEERVEERTRQLVEAEEALRQAQKMEAVGQLTGGIAHDFNNLLAGISGSLELLERGIAQGRSDRVERYIDAAQGGARRAAALTQRLLAFSRRQTLDPKPIDLSQLVGGMTELISRTVGPQVELVVRAEEDLWTVRADPSQLESALLNLTINARDAMAPNGGTLTVSTSNVSAGRSLAKTLGMPQGDYAVLEVADTGAGMSAATQERAFEPFFTTKPLGQGTGLGLSMVYGFVRQSGGQVAIESEPGKGAAVRLYLPRFTGKAVAVDPDAGAPASAEGGSERVLVVDDEETVRTVIADLLTDQGYRVTTAADGAAGLKALEADGEAGGFDLLITDVGLPGGMNGRQLADAALTTWPSLKVLFVTGYAESSVLGDGGLAQGMEVITKPFTTADLARRAAGLLGR